MVVVSNHSDLSSVSHYFRHSLISALEQGCPTNRFGLISARNKDLVLHQFQRNEKLE